MPSYKQKRTIGDLVKAEKEEQVRGKCRPHGLQESCRTKRRKLPEGVSEVVGLIIELEVVAVVAT